MNDITNSVDIAEATPHISKLASEGVELSRYYAQACCTPGRAAILSGRYSWRSGMQYGNLFNDSPFGLATHYELLPEVMQKQNYATHIVGKWDVGAYAHDMWPTKRGFDSFFGMVGDAFDWVTHKADLDYAHEDDFYTDLHENESNAHGWEGNYSTWMWGNRTVAIIDEHARAKPEQGLFVYLALNAMHDSVVLPGAKIGQWLEVAMQERLAQNVGSTRLQFAAGMMLVDDVIGDVVKAVKAAGLYKRSLVVITSDNGAPTPQAGGVNGGSNYPYRGGKMYYMEGGVRVPAYVHSPLIPKAMRGREYRGLFHATDWLPTLGYLAGAAAGSLAFADGVDHGRILFDEADDTASHLRTTVPLMITYLGYNESGEGGNGAFVADLPATNRTSGGTYKIMMNTPKIYWYGPEDNEHFCSNGANGTHCTGFSFSDYPTYMLYDLGNDPFETTNLWAQLEYRAVRAHMARLFCTAYLTMTPSNYQSSNRTGTKKAFNDNDNYTTWVVETTTQSVYRSLWWATPTMSNCTFAEFMDA